VVDPWLHELKLQIDNERFPIGQLDYRIHGKLISQL